MARAAAKRKTAPKPPAGRGPSRQVRKANRPVEATLFFHRIRKGTKFEDVAKKNSEGPTAAQSKEAQPAATAMPLAKTSRFVGNATGKAREIRPSAGFDPRDCRGDRGDEQESGSCKNQEYNHHPEPVPGRAFVQCHV